MNIDLSRRSFVAGAAAFGFCPAWAIGRDEKPFLRFGVMTDTHLTKWGDSKTRVAGAFKVFKAQGVDVIGHCGDLADLHFDDEYRFYRKTIETTYPDKATRPELLYVYANHDALNPNVKDKSDHAARIYDIATAMGWMREKIGIEHDFYCEKTIRGIPFIVTPQTWSIVKGGAKYIEERLASVCAANPGKPVVFMTHLPPAGTAYNSSSWGDGSLTRLFSKYPQVIAFTGHTHGSLRNELSIWQGAFTEVDVCCLQQWEGSCVGQHPKSKQAYDVLVVEFYDGRIVLRRFDVRDGSEYKADDPWVVPLPFDPKTAPFRHEARKAAERPAAFPADAKIDVTTEKAPFDKVTVAFTASDDVERVFKYRIRLARRTKDGWENYAMVETFSEFYARPKDRKGKFSHAFSSMYFPEGEEVLIRVEPVGFFGTAGKPLERVWTAHGGVKAVSTWVSERPMEEFPFVFHWWPRNAKEWLDAKPQKLKDGWLECIGAHHFLTLPKEPFDAPKGTRFRFAVDLRMKQDPINDGVTLGAPGLYVMTVPGDEGLVRYVGDFTAGGKNVPRRVVLSRSKGLARFERLTLERLP